MLHQVQQEVPELLVQPVLDRLVQVQLILIQMEIQDQDQLRQEVDQVVQAQEALLDRAVQEAQEVTVEDQAQVVEIAQEGIHRIILEMINLEETIPETTQEETLLAVATQEEVTIKVGLITRVMTILRQIRITLLGMEIAAMVIRQENPITIQEAKARKGRMIRRMKTARTKALTKALRRALKKKAQKR